MRRFLLVIIGLAALVMLGLFLLPVWLSNTDTPGTDLSRFHPSAVPGHITALKSAEAATRKEAAKTLWQIGVAARAATPVLLETAKDADPQVRAAAVKALVRTSQETQDAVPALIEALRDADADVRAEAADSLAAAWRVAGKGRAEAVRVPRGRAGFAQGNAAPNPREIVRLLPAYEPLAQKALPALTASLRDADARVRAHACEALGETGPLAEPAVADLVRLVQKDADQDVRLQATLALARTGPGAKAAVPALVALLRDEKADGVRVNTAVALGMIHSSPRVVVPALVETFLKDKYPDARVAAMMSIGLFGPDAAIAVPMLKAAKGAKDQPSEAALRSINQLLNFIEGQVQKSPAEPAEENAPPPPRN
jgi:HEAT repeat protein